MLIQKYIKHGTYSSYEEGILFTTGILRYTLNDKGLHKVSNSQTFKDTETITNEELPEAIINCLGDLIRGDKSIQEDLLFTMDKEVVMQFVEDNIKEW